LDDKITKLQHVVTDLKIPEKQVTILTNAQKGHADSLLKAEAKKTEAQKRLEEAQLKVSEAESEIAKLQEIKSQAEAKLERAKSRVERKQAKKQAQASKIHGDSQWAEVETAAHSLEDAEAEPLRYLLKRAQPKKDTNMEEMYSPAASPESKRGSDSPRATLLTPLVGSPEGPTTTQKSSTSK